MVRICIGFLIGLSCLSWLENLVQSYLLLFLSSFLLFLFFFYLNKTSYIKRPLIFICLGLIWGSATISIWLNTSSKLVDKPINAEIEGFVCDIPIAEKITSSKTTPDISIKQIEEAVYRLNFTFCLTKIEDQEINFYHSNKVKLNYYRTDQQLKDSLLSGTHWKLIAKLKPIHGRLNPGGFDYEKWLVSEGYVATGYVKHSEQIVNNVSLISRYHQARQRIFDKLTSVLPQSELRGIIYALAMGERRSINPQQWQAVQGSGTSHLLAISGLHIGIAAMWSYYLVLFIVSRLHWVATRIAAQTIAQIASLTGATSISLISGLGYPAQRALIMLSVFLIVRWLGRQMSLANTLALSVLVITLLQPFSVLTISFWLSVVAVSIIALILSYQQKSNGQHRSFKDWIRLNWFLFLGLIPITWITFDGFSMVAFAANLLLIPLTSFISTPLIYIGMLLILFNTNLASWVFIVVDKAIWLTYQIQRIFSELNQAISFPALPIELFLLLLFSMIIILLPNKIPGKAMLVPIIILNLLMFFEEPPEDKFKMVVFDIGQGLAIHISVGDKHLLYDTGYGSRGFSMASSSLIPYFKRQGIEQIDKFIASHDDADHSGGFTQVNQQLVVKQILAGEKITADNKNLAKDCHQSQGWSWSGVSFQFIPHQHPLTRKGNNASCVLQIVIEPYQGQSEQTILLTGDIEKRAERSLLQHEPVLLKKSIDLLVAPHHGSLTSSTEPFVNYLRPKLVIFSAGYANRWSFPKQKVVQRYDKVEARSLTTWRQGAISVTQNERGKLIIETERDENKHFWQAL